MKKFLSVLVLVIAAYLGWDRLEGPATPGATPATSPATATRGDAVLARAFEEQKSGVQVEGSGVVIKVLPDDDEGSRHQRFLLRLGSGQTLMIAHNIDLAPRLSSLTEGDTVAFHGEYEWSAKGGVIHWTHHDPAGRHVGGWLEHHGQRFQ